MRTRAWRVIGLAAVAVWSLVLTDAAPAFAHDPATEPMSSVIARSIPLVPNAAPTEVMMGRYPGNTCAQLDDAEHEACLAEVDAIAQWFTVQVETGGIYTVWVESLDADYVALPTLNTQLVVNGEPQWERFMIQAFPTSSYLWGPLAWPGTDLLATSAYATGYWYDKDVQPDFRSADAVRRDVFGFVADADRTWSLNILTYGDFDWPGAEAAAQAAESHGPYRVWVQRLDDLSVPLTVRERFAYPTAAELVMEQGATVYREFLVTEPGGLKPSTGLSATLSPAGSCDMPEGGRLRCSIPTAGLAPGVQTFTFASAIRDGATESVTSWPGFSFTVAEREIVTKAQVTADASAKIDFAAFVEGATDAGLSVEFRTDGGLTLESSRSIAFDVGTTVGEGAGVKLGPISPRAKAEIEVSGGVQAFESLVIDVADPNETAQSLAIASFVLDSALENIENAVPGMTLQIELIRQGLSLRDRYQPYLTSDQFGVAASVKAQGQLGVFTTNRRGLAPFSYGLGGAANSSISVGWQEDYTSGEQALVARTSRSAFGVLDPLGWDLHFAGDVIDFSGSAGGTLEATFTFAGSPSVNSLTTAAFKVTAGTTSSAHITGDSVTIVFGGPELRAAGGTLEAGLTELLDPLSSTEFSPTRLEEVFDAALKQVEAKVTVTETRGTGFAPSLAVGGNVTVGGKVGGEAQVGGEWQLTVTQTTQRWQLLTDNAGTIALVQLSDFPFEETAASNNTATEIVNKMFTDAMTDALAGSLVGNWIAGQVIAAGSEGAFDASNARTGTATLWLDGVEREIRDEVGTVLPLVEFGIRLWGSEYLPDFIVSGQGLPVSEGGTTATRQMVAQSADFFASEFLDIAPYGITVDPGVRISLSYLATPADPQTLRIYRYEGNGVWLPLATTIDAASKVATANVSVFGTFVVGLDDVAPTITTGEDLASFVVLITDAESGVDAASVTLTANGVPVASSFDALLGLVTPTGSISSGATVVVTASDMAGNVSTASAVVTNASGLERSTALVTGLSALPHGSTAAVAPSEIVAGLGDAGAVESILGLDNGVWLSYGPSRPSFANTLTTIDPWMPLLLRMTSPTTWDGSYEVPTARTAVLGTGFTYVTYTGDDLANASDVMSQLSNSGGVDALFRFDESTQNWQSFRPTSPAFANSLQSIGQFDAILVLTTQAMSWSIPAP
jgi:hypothetical protein